ncbi:MAG: low-specificity L-threonine aldolase [Clostridiaceae bacterium]|nr:low-specificity L-threonine aldolase [Clostridiaceae bacterium]
MKVFDFRSDTVTLPTEEMMKKIVEADLGDDVYGDDLTVNKLEAQVAEMLGKEAALFVPTGTMGNLLAVMTHTTPGQEVILEENCHIYLYEVGGIARVAGVQARTIKSTNGIMNPEDVKVAIRKDDIHFPETGLICLENSHNMSGGAVIPLDNMKRIYEVAKEKNIPLHLDGARIFNAATYLNVEVKEIAQYTDSLMFCFSKGLSAPIGSVLIGTEDFIRRARKFRKMLGGGMRQVGIIASAAIHSLEEMTSRLKEDHENARILAEGLNKIAGVSVDMESIHTNIINVNFAGTRFNTSELMDKFKEKGLLVNPRNQHVIRFVTHKDVNKGDVLAVISLIKDIVE